MMMSVVGLELTIADFRRAAAHPKVIILGTLAQLSILPLGTAVLLLVYPLAGHIAAGMVLIAAAPGGGISNVFTFLAGANTALSVILTAVASLAAIVSFPVLSAIGIELLLGERIAVEVPIVPLIGQLVVLVLLPITLGMFIRRRRPDLATRYATPLRRLTFVAIIGLLVIAMASDTTGLAGDVTHGLIAAFIWTLMAMVLGWGLARMAGLDRDDAFTFLIEFSVKNVGFAAIVALAVLDRPDLAVFFGSYVLIGYPLAGLFAFAYRRTVHPFT
jgi:BASS family bile acid:Na+ symporter